MKLKSSLLAAALVLVSSSAYSAETMVSFKVWSLAKVRFTNMATNKEVVFTPEIKGSNDEGDLEGWASVSIPEGIYLVRGDQHMPAELGTVCQITDRVIIVKDKVEASALKSDAFGYASNATGKAAMKQVCWEDFDAIGRVPDFRLK